MASRHVQCVYLYSGQASNQLTIVNQRKLETQLDAHKIDYVKLDGMEPANKDARKAIWDKLGVKPGTYPIVIELVTGEFWHGDELQIAMDNSTIATKLKDFIKQ